MRALSMDLPPFPKPDSAEGFLKDAPQEDSKFGFFSQYLLKYNLILFDVWLESVWRQI